MTHEIAISPEIVKKEYVHSVKSVAKEMFESFFPPDYIKSLWQIHHVENYLSSFRKIMKMGYENGRDDSSFSHKVISELIKKGDVNKQVEDSTDAVPWTIAVAILTEDESIKGLSDTRLRFIFDLAIGVAADDYHERHIGTKRNAAYEKDPEFKEELSKYSAHWKTESEWWEKFQDKLRQKISPTGKIERK